MFVLYFSLKFELKFEISFSYVNKEIIKFIEKVNMDGRITPVIHTVKSQGYQSCFCPKLVSHTNSRLFPRGNMVE